MRPQRASSRVLRRYGLLLLFAAGMLALVLALLHWHSRSRAIPQIRAVAVLPLENPGADATRYLADGITDTLISDLGRISSVRVTSRASAMSLRQTNRTIPEIAHELGVDAVVDGSVIRNANQIQITAQLSDGKTGRHLWKRECAGQISNSLQLASDMAHDLAAQFNMGASPQARINSAGPRQIDSGAQDAYLQGEYFMNRSTPGSYQEAIGYFQSAIEKDPAFAPAYAGLGAVYWKLGEYGLLKYSTAYSNAQWAARKAIELDTNISEAHTVLAQTLADLDWDWKAAEVEFRRAIQLNPSSSAARFAYAHYLEKTGRIQEAITEAETGSRLDPISLDAYDRVAHVYYFSRQYDRGLESIRKAAELYRTSANPLHWDLAVIYVEKGNLQKAIDRFQIIGDLPHVLGHMGNAYARAGQIENAKRMIAKLLEHVAKDGLGTYEIALIYAGLGCKDEAFAWLGKSYQTRDKGLTFLKIDPCVDPLRSDPRFKNLLRRVGLAG